MAEVATTGEDHRDSIAVCHANRLLVANGAAGLDNRRHTRLCRRLDAIREGEIGVGGQHGATRARSCSLDREMYAGNAHAD